MATTPTGLGKSRYAAPKPQDDAERDFVRIIEDGRRKLFEGPGAIIPQSKRREVLAGFKIKGKDGDVICTLADADYLLRFREARRRRQATRNN